MSSKPSRVETGFATGTGRGRKASKQSLLKRIKKLIDSSSPKKSNAQSSASSTASDRYRAEALKSCGFLKQSVKYGAPYRDEGENAKMIVSPEKRPETKAEVKDLLIFEDKAEVLTTQEKSTIDDKMMPVYSPTTPLTWGSVSGYTISDSASTVESDTSTLAARRPPIRMRRIGSLVEEVDQIENEECRRLTELAFLS